MTVIIDAIRMCDDRALMQEHHVEHIKRELGETPKLVIINASDDEGNARYIKGKVREGTRVGIEVEVIKLESDCTDRDIQDILTECRSTKTPAIVQLPIFPHLNEKLIFNEISEDIDADGFMPFWLGLLAIGKFNHVCPATPKGAINILDFHNVEIEGKTALVIGRSNHVGKPIANMLIAKGATTICANSKTENLSELVKMADIVVSCAGKVDLVKACDVKKGAVLIGVGFTYVNGKQILDFDIEEIVQDGKAMLVTNRVNCTGKATISALMDNVIELYYTNYCMMDRFDESEVLSCISK